ncbi:glycerophosphodiester phosphodiesterase family protein [Alkalilimnicola sp. S0819]|uniref:glycerophosphodiester phosphodiesterase family protein n=1 Tax=Alkalilimnicola sp. S0819 TaxID=2613922 RepID=UPI001869B70D|nr:glycerophosphodiester phosphodiesterase family protein [Alkalilimnicola sp. S0819]
MSQPRLIAHRGDIGRYPENTLEGLRAAAEAGAQGVELDVQFSRDGEPVVIHDPDLRRIGGGREQVQALSLEQLRQRPAGEPERFGDRFREVRLAGLAETAAALAAWPELTVFVEVKTDTLPRYRLPACVQQVLAACAPLGKQLVLISYADEVLQEARSLRAGLRTGRALHNLDAAERERCELLRPDFVFCDIELLPAGTGAPCWGGDWEWVVYEINEPEEARRLHRQGFDWVETGDLRALAAARDTPTPPTP